MDKREIIHSFFKEVISQNENGIRNYLSKDTCIRWHNTNERFNIEEYIIANCEYPGDWCGEIERVMIDADNVVTASRVWTADNSASFHVVSFFSFSGDKIDAIDEYWGDDGEAPQWRIDKHIGQTIK